VLISLLGVAIGAFPRAHAALDIRVSGLLVSGQDRTSYVVRVADCTSLVSVVIGSGSAAETRGVEDASSTSDNAACEFTFEATGASRLTPTVTAHYADGTFETHTETFAVDEEPPSLTLEGVSFAKLGGRQHLVVSLQAADDTDISYVAVSVVGLRASQLRAAGGIVDQARQGAFADTGGFLRLPPTDGSGAFELVVPVGTLTAAGDVIGELDPDAISSDGLVLVEAHAVDASGNQTSLSKIVLTGGDLDEAVSSLSTLPDRILFTNLLEMATIVPTVDFQFRGPTPLPGSGSGVRYTSNHPEIVAVTSSGLVYPLAETAVVDVRITASYGTFSDDVPVEVNTSKSLVGLRMDGLDTAGRWVLPSLNRRYPIHSVIGIFDDGTEAAVGSQFALDVVVDPAGAGIVDLDAETGVLSMAAIGDGAPVDVTISLHSSPTVATTVPLVARDALPTVSLSLASTIGVGETLDIAPTVRDDVGIAEVRFFLNGELIGVRNAAPFSVSLDIDESMRNSELRIRAEATDTAGGVADPDESVVRVSDTSHITVPAVTIDVPELMERYIEGSAIRYQASSPVGAEPSRTTVAFVEFIVDGAPVGESRYPIFENRCSVEVPCYFEVWRVTGLVGDVSTGETTRVLQAVSHGFGGTSTPGTGRPFVVAANQEPLAVVLSPATGDSITAGERLAVEVEVADDTLGAGVDVDLLLDGVANQSFRVGDSSGGTRGSRVLARARHTFFLTVPASRLGTTLTLQARATDFHSERALSGEVRLLVQEDQPPTVSVSHPVAGSRVVSGSLVELRADAVDDISVNRVDFFVDGSLVGADSSAPYSYFFRSPGGVVDEQPLTIHAVATDSVGHSARSADVTVTLGRDDQPPVVNLVSPTITRTEAGADIADVTEETDVTLRITGYDKAPTAPGGCPWCCGLRADRRPRRRAPRGRADTRSDTGSAARVLGHQAVDDSRVQRRGSRA